MCGARVRRVCREWRIVSASRVRTWTEQLVIFHRCVAPRRVCCAKTMCRHMCVHVLFSALPYAACYYHLAFDSARASSTYSSGSDPFAFVADEAVSPGARYWCSSDAHSLGEVVTWTGSLDARRGAVGINLHWAYGPGEWKILVSGDGSNFEEVQCWQTAARTEVAYGHTVMFGAPVAVRAVTLVMRSPRSWGYFGLSRAVLLAEPGPIMIVSGASSAAGELCLVVVGGADIALKPCLACIAAADGADIFKFSSQGQLVNIASQTCATFADGDA